MAAIKVGVDADLDVTPVDVGGGRGVRRHGQPGLDETVGNAVDGDVHASPFLGQGLRHADKALGKIWRSDTADAGHRLQGDTTNGWVRRVDGAAFLVRLSLWSKQFFCHALNRATRGHH